MPTLDVDPTTAGDLAGPDLPAALFDALAVGVVVQVADGRIVRSNPAAEHILGLDRDQIMGRTSADPRWRAIRQDGSPYPGDEHPAMVALRTGQPVRDAVMGVARPDGSHGWISITAVPLPPDVSGRPAGALSSFVDITGLVDARREAQELGERLTLATEGAGVGVLCWEFRTGEVTLDVTAARLFGAPAAGARAAVELLERVEPPHREVLVERLRDDFPGGLRPGVELWVRMPTGERRRLSARAVLHRDADGRAQRIVGTVHDVTAEWALRDAEIARVAAESASRAKSLLLARVSHDLRTPLNAILGFAQLLQLQPGQPPEAVRDNAAQIVASGRHLLAVVSDLLDASQLDAGVMRLTIDPVPIAPLLESIGAMMRAEAESAGVRLTIVPPGTLSALADATRLRQVLCNLVGNGIRYNRTGGGVFVRAAAVGESIRFDVIDTGRGIAPGDQERVFDPFHRVSPADGPAIEGTGLGLSICRGLVERMGGRITVRSRTGSGSVFSVYLPVAVSG
jgi:PAS domain S-box-containing protein